MCCNEGVCSKPESFEHNHYVSLAFQNKKKSKRSSSVPISFEKLPAKKMKWNPPKTIQTKLSFWGPMAGKPISERVILPKTKTISPRCRISSPTITSSSKKVIPYKANKDSVMTPQKKF